MKVFLVLMLILYITMCCSKKLRNGSIHILHSCKETVLQWKPSRAFLTRDRIVWCRESRFFMVTALLAGLILCVVTPPLTVPDEVVHFPNAYAVSEGNLLTDIVDGQPGRLVPTSLQDVPGISEYISVYEKKFTYKDLLLYRLYAKEISHKHMYRVDSTDPLGYTFAALGMKAFRTIESVLNFGYNSAYNNLVAGRIGNVLAFVILVGMAINIIPFYKKTMVLLALMPMTLQQAASTSYDILLIACAFLLTAQTLALCRNTEKPVKVSEICVIIFCVFFLAGIKSAAYLPTISILLFVPYKKYGNPKRCVACIALVVLAAVLGYVPTLLNRRIAAAYTVRDTAIVQQTEWLMAHLSSFPGILINTLCTKREFYISSFWGIFGYLDTVFPFPIQLLSMCLIAFTALQEACNCPDIRFGLKRPLVALGVLVSFVGIFVVMYVEWTPLSYVSDTIGGNNIDGVQGRYFIPLVMQALILLSNSLIPHLSVANHSQSKPRLLSWRIVQIGGLLTCLYSVLIMLLRFWI